MKIKTILLTAAFSALFPLTALAGEEVTVTLPDFKVTMNHTEVNSANSQYPFFVYKDITYVPMTYHDTRLLGLNSQWTAESGLTISKMLFFDSESAKEQYQPYYQEAANQRSYQATTVDFTVTVGDKAIDNQTEEYPLLLFRDVTYFPLTWRFAVNEFGWEYHFDADSGLVITPTSTQPTTTMSPSIPSGNIVITGNVVNVRANNSTDSEIIAQVKSGDVLASLRKENDWYHVILSDGRVGWIAGWLAVEQTDEQKVDQSQSTNQNNNNTVNNNSAPTVNTNTTMSPSQIDLDDSHQLNIKQIGIDSIIYLEGLEDKNYSLTKNNDHKLTIKVTDGKFKSQSYPIGQFGINSVAVSGQLVSIDFTGKITYAEKYTPETKTLQLTVKNMGNENITQNPMTNNDVNLLRMQQMTPQEAQTVLELVIGAENGARVTSSTSDKIVVEIDNNSTRRFSPVTGSIGPITRISARDMADDKAEITLELQKGAYCVLDKSGENLRIVAKNRNSAQSQGLSGKTIVLDPGHGGKDPGAIGLVLGITDREVGMGVCNTLKTLLENAGANVVMTRTDQYGFLTVGERAELSNQVEADIFVSVHANSAAPKRTPFGTQVYYYAPSGGLTLAAQKPIRLELATLVSDHISAQTGRKSGVYTQNLGVLRENNSPSILVEAGFLSNPEEEALMADQNYLDKIAQGIFNGLVAYLQVN